MLALASLVAAICKLFAAPLEAAAGFATLIFGAGVGLPFYYRLLGIGLLSSLACSLRGFVGGGLLLVLATVVLLLMERMLLLLFYCWHWLAGLLRTGCLVVLVCFY